MINKVVVSDLVGFIGHEQHRHWKTLEVHLRNKKSKRENAQLGKK